MCTLSCEGRRSVSQCATLPRDVRPLRPQVRRGSASRATRGLDREQHLVIVKQGYGHGDILGGKALLAAQVFSASPSGLRSNSTNAAIR